MNEVSCRVFGVFWEPLAHKRVPLESIVAGTGISLDRLHNKRERIDWAEFAAVMRNMRPHFTDDEYTELGRRYLRTPGLRFAFVIARLALSAMDFYRWFSKPREGVGNQMFNCVIPAQRELGPNEIELDLTVPEGYEACWDFFVISRGNLEEMPRLLGLPRAKVTLTPLPRGGRYHVVIPQGSPLLARIWRFLTRPFTLRAAARELQEAHEALIDRYEEIEAARTKLDRQAAQLRTAHAVNELVLRDVDLERTLDTVTKALVDEAGFAAAALTLAPADGARPATARFGDAEDGPQLTRTLEARGGERVGALSVTLKRGADRAEREDLLAFITPTLAIALQNALYRIGLERLVDERTRELRQARDQLTQTIAQLRDAQGARERFFGNISHEIRTPLTIILLAARDIERRAGGHLDDRARMGLGAVTDSARRLVRLVDELLLLAAGQEGKLSLRPEPTDLAALVVGLSRVWTPAAEAADITLRVDVPAHLVANVDPVALERVATNLLSNALKYTPRGGRVELELREQPESVCLSVRDTGPGIPADLAGRLFGRFERAESERRRTTGTGLGLSLVKQLVEAHGGTVEAKARPTGGAELRVLLPRAVVLADTPPPPTQLRLVVTPPAAAIAPSPATLPQAVTRTSQGSVLVAEDDPTLAEMIAQLLGDEHRVFVAHDGAAALELARRHHPQLLVTDIEMPGLDGIELAKQFRAINNDRLAPIILLSAVLDLRTRLEGFDAGAVDYVTKPFDPAELKARVQAQFRMRDLAVRLQRAEQLSMLGVLTSGLAHELRNPANGVINAVAPLRALLPPDLTTPEHAVGQLLEVIGDCAAQLNTLSRQLLGFRSGGAALELRPVHLRELVTRALAMCKAALDGIEVQVEIPEASTVHCAPPLMLQVLTNLLENASHAAGRGGWIEVVGRVADGRISCEVADSGPGVPIELRTRVFEPFFTTEPQGLGTGLGLPVSREIVARHGGLLDIRDRGARAVFVVELPQHPTGDARAG